MRLSFIVGEVGEAMSRLKWSGLPGGRGGAIPIKGKPSLLCGRAPSFSDMWLAGSSPSSSESSPGPNGLSIRGGGGAPGHARVCQQSSRALRILDLRSEGEAGASGAG